MQEVEYKCYTNKGSWKFTTTDESAREAMRLALYYCWRDGEVFDRIEYNRRGEHYVLRINYIDLKKGECFTIM